MLLFSLQAELAVHLQSAMVRYLTFLEREKIAAYFVCSCLFCHNRLWEMPSSKSGFVTETMLLKASRSPLAVQHHLELEEHSCGLRVAPGGPGMRKVEVGPIPASCCRQKFVSAVLCNCALRYLDSLSRALQGHLNWCLGGFQPHRVQLTFFWECF